MKLSQLAHPRARLAVDVVTILLLGAAAWRAYPAVTSTVIASQHSELAVPEGKSTLVLVFQQRDCASYAAFLNDWGPLPQNQALRILAVPLKTAGKNAAMAVAEDFAIQFDVSVEFASTATSMLRRFGQLQTPAAILVDPRGNPKLLLTPESGMSNELNKRLVSTYLEVLQ